MRKPRYLQIRLSDQQLDKVEKMARELGVGKSLLMRELIDTAIVTGAPRLLVGAQK